VCALPRPSPASDFERGGRRRTGNLELALNNLDLGRTGIKTQIWGFFGGILVTSWGQMAQIQSVHTSLDYVGDVICSLCPTDPLLLDGG